METEGVCFTVGRQSEEKWRSAKQSAGSVFENTQRPLLLFFGMKDLTNGLDAMNPNNVKRGGFTGARSLTVDGVNIRVPSDRNMKKAKDSPFEFDGKCITDRITGGKWAVAEPKFDLTGKGLKRIAATPEGMVEAMTFVGCDNVDMGLKCQFCPITGADGKLPVPAREIADEVRMLRELGVKVKMAVLNTGQMENGREIEPILAVAREIKLIDASIRVSAEVWPGSLPRDLGSAKGAIDVFQVNIELADDTARGYLCPGKPSRAEYFAAFERLSSAGFQVSSVIQTNYYLQIEPIETVIGTMNRMLDMGVVPELLISRAVKGSSVTDGYWDRETSFDGNVERFGIWLSRMRSIATSTGLRLLEETRKIQGGCAKCGMCNANKDLGQGQYPTVMKNQTVGLVC